MANRSERSFGLKNLIIPCGCLVAVVILLLALLFMVQAIANGTGLIPQFAGRTEFLAGTGDTDNANEGKLTDTCKEIPKNFTDAVKNYPKFLPFINKYAAQFNLSPAFVAAIIMQESKFRPEAVSPVGAQGLMQLMPGTFDQMRAGDTTFAQPNVFDPEQNIYFGTKYLASVRTTLGTSDLRFIAAGYNAGPGAAGLRQKPYSIPNNDETQKYVRQVVTGPTKADGPPPRPWITIFRNCLTGGAVITAGDSQSLAKQILNNGKITLFGNSQTNIQEVADGKNATITCGNDFNASSTPLSPKTLGGLLTISRSFKIRVTALANGCHTGKSDHYVGQAVDIDLINEEGISKANPHFQEVMDLCITTGATPSQVFGPSNDPDGNHQGHIHCAWEE